MRRLVFRLILPAFVFAAIIPLRWYFSYEAGAAVPGSPAGQTAGGKGAQPQRIPVVAVSAKREDVPVYMTGLGTIKAFNTVTITPQATGPIVQVAFTEGQMVGKGDLVAQIDPRPYQNALDQAQGQLIKDRAQLDNARLDLQRYTTLAAQNSIALQQRDTQKALVVQDEGIVKSDEAQVQIATLNLSYCRILSPIAGRTGLRQIDIGNILQAGSTQPIVVVTQLQPISVIFTLPEEAFEAVRTSMKGTVPVYAFARDDTTQLDTGSLLTIDNEIDPTTGTVRLKATFPNMAVRLWPGAFINARVLLGTEHGVVTVPQVAVQHGPNGDFVYVVRDNQTAEERSVRTGLTDHGITVIAQGLRAGERVVTEGQYKLENGAPVSVAPIVVARAGGRGP